MLCAIWYYWCNLKNVKKTHGWLLLLVKLQALFKHLHPTQENGKWKNFVRPIERNQK